MRKLTLTFLFLYVFFFANFSYAQDYCMGLVSDDQVVGTLCVEQHDESLATFTWGAVFPYTLHEVTLEFDEELGYQFLAADSITFSLTLPTPEVYLVTSQVLLSNPVDDSLLWAYTP